MKVAYDQYQRYKTISLIIEKTKEKYNCKTVKILEVGANLQCNLEKFLPEDDIYYSDIILPEEVVNNKHFIVADATDLREMSKGEYDVVIASDVFEHIPYEKRERFINEINRTSRLCSIICFPFKAKHIYESENRVNMYYKSIYGKDYNWLKEHIENGLPDLIELNNYLTNKKIPYVNFQHGDINMWEKLMYNHFTACFFEELISYREQIDEYYNEHVYMNDISNENYRIFYIMGKNQEDRNYYHDLVKNIFTVDKNAKDKSDKIDIMSKKLSDINNLRTRIKLFERTQEYNDMIKFLTAEQLNNIFYINYGEGFNANSKVVQDEDEKVICKNGNIIFYIPEGAKQIRIDPVEGKNLIIYNLNIIGNTGKVIEYESNGFKYGEFQIYDTFDPNILIDVTGISWIKLMYDAIAIDSIVINKIIKIMKKNKLEINELNKQQKKMIEKNKFEINELNKQQKKAIELNEKSVIKKIYDKDIHIKNIEKMLNDERNYHEKINHIIKNPFYGMKIIVKKCLKKILPNKIVYAIYSLKNEGVLVILYKIKKKLTKESKMTPYEKWIKNSEKNMKKVIKQEYNPLISIIVPVYNVSSVHLKACINSVIKQTYKNWELCLSDDASTWKNVKKVLKKYEHNNKIKVAYRTSNGHISRASNTAIDLATGEFIAFLDCDDTLSPNALYEMVKKVNEDKKLDFIYSDEDKIDEEGQNRHMPFFKPDWSPDTFLSCMYTCHFSMYRKNIADRIGRLRIGYEGAQDYDFVLRYVEETNNIGHIPKILYHWRERKESTAKNQNNKNYAFESTLKAKNDALSRRGIVANLIFEKEQLQYRIDYAIIGEPLVSIIIPSKDNYEILKSCIESIDKYTSYLKYEIIIVDNGSDDKNKCQYLQLCKKYNIKYEYNKSEFNFSSMCNKGSQLASGEILLFLNDDVEVMSQEWLNKMIGQAQQKHVGAVGVKLLYPDGNLIQHSGVLNLKVGPSHGLLNFNDEYSYYFGRNKLVYDYCAVTGACIMMEKSKFDEIGRFDEELPIAYNDVELCFRMLEHNYYNVVRNDVTLKHYESVSRGQDYVDLKKMERLKKELEILYEKHSMLKWKDPFYNINLVTDQINYEINTPIHGKKNQIRGIKYRDIIQDKNIDANIDFITIQDQIIIEGWARYNKGKFNNCYSKSIYLLGEDNTISKIRTSKVYRSDIGEILKNKKLNLIAFSCVFERKSLRNQKYQVVIGIKTIAGKVKYYITKDKIDLCKTD